MQDLWLRKTVRMVIGRPIETTGQTVDSFVPLAEQTLRDLLPTYRDPGGVKLLRNRLTRLF
jgi:hypothetical protein